MNGLGQDAAVRRANVHRFDRERHSKGSDDPLCFGESHESAAHVGTALRVKCGGLRYGHRLTRRG